MLTWLQWTAHWASLLPLGTLGVLWLRHRHRDVAYLWVASAFAVSWMADTSVSSLGLHPWLVARVYPLLQFALLYGVFLERPKAKKWALRVAGLGILSLWQSAADAPEIVASVGGSVILCEMIWARKELGALRTGLLFSFGVSACFLFWFPVLVERNLPLWFLWAWLGYQTSRIIGLLIVSWAIWKRPTLAIVR